MADAPDPAFQAYKNAEKKALEILAQMKAQGSQKVDIELAFDNGLSAHQQFYSDQDAKTARNYKIVYTDSGAREDAFSATIESIEPGDQSAEGTDAQSATITFGLAAAATITW